MPNEGKKNYGRRSTDLSDTKKRLIAISLFLIIVAFTAIVILYSYMTHEVNYAQSKYIEINVDNRFSLVQKYIENELYSDAKTNADKYANEIEREIKSSYSEDLNDLKDEMSSGNYTKLSELISNILNTDEKYLNGIEEDNNSIIVATNKDIIYNTDYETIIDESSSGHETWDEFIDANYNDDLAKKAVESLTTYPQSLIIIEPTKSKDTDHRYYKEVSMNTLKRIYRKEGLDGLKNYEMLVPSYIQDTEDIFGIPEISQGVRQDTSRLIIIQRCNIYDQIMKNKPSLEKGSVKLVNSEHERLMTLMYFVGVMIGLGIVSCMVPVVFLFNNYIIGKKEAPLGISKKINNKTK